MTGYYNIMNVYGGGNKLVWPTEFGWASAARSTLPTSMPTTTTTRNRRSGRWKPTK